MIISDLDCEVCGKPFYGMFPLVGLILHKILNHQEDKVNHGNNIENTGHA